MPPGAGHGNVAGLGAAFGAPGFWIRFAAWGVAGAAARTGAAWWLSRHLDLNAGAARRVVEPLLWGALAPAGAFVVDAVAFWCAAPPLAALGLGLGTIGAARRLSSAIRAAPPAAGAARVEQPDPVRLAIALLAVAVPVALLPGWSAAGGDEPHYLVVTHSLLSDTDLDVADDYADRVYAPFHPASLSPHYKPGLASGSRYSMHGVGLPLLLVPAYALGGLIGPNAMIALPRLSLIALYGVFAWMLFGFIEELAGTRAARCGTVATVLAAPLLFAPLAVFPEVPAMTLALLVFRAARRPGDGPWLAAAPAIAFLPWLGVKYIPLAAALGIVGVFGAGPSDRRRRLASAAVALGASLALHAGFTWRLYGSFSPAALYLGTDPSAAAPALGGDWQAYVAAWPAAVGTAVGYLLDQKEGLLAYAPHFLLAAAGAPWMWRHRRFESVASIAVICAYLGPYALSQQLSGQGPPLRPLMAVLWVLGPALGVGLSVAGAGSRVAYARLRGGLLGLSAMLTVAYAAQPSLLPHDYPVKASNLIRAYSPYGSGAWSWFPQWVNIGAPNWPTTALWSVAAGVLAVWVWRVGAAGVRRDDRGRVDAGAQGDGRNRLAAAALGDPPGGGERSLRAAAVVVAVTATFVLLHHILVVTTDRHRPRALEAGPIVWVVEELPEVAWAEAGGVWATAGRAVDFILTDGAPLASLDVELRVLVGASVEAWVGDDGLARAAAPGASVAARLFPGPGRRVGDGYAYQARLRSSAGAAPADVEGGADERQLGVFFQVRGRQPR